MPPHRGPFGGVKPDAASRQPDSPPALAAPPLVASQGLADAPVGEPAAAPALSAGGEDSDKR